MNLEFAAIAVPGRGLPDMRWLQTQDLCQTPVSKIDISIYNR